MTTHAGVSIITTIRNEMPNVAEWLDALLNQSRCPDEIVIVDGGSTDGAWELVQRMSRRSAVPITLDRLPGATIAAGRNRAVALATGEILAITDAGTVADQRWLERLLRPLEAGTADVAAGFFRPRLDTCWRRSLAAATLPESSELDEATFQPSSRSVAIRRAWFSAGVAYPEWLDYCEDLVWDSALRRAGARFTFVRDAIVTFDVRPTPAAYARQYYRYARGDGKAGLFPARHALRYLTYATLGLTLARRRRSELALAVLLGCAYVRRPLARLRARDDASELSWSETARAAPAVVALRALGDLAKMAGYPAGLIWRLRGFGGLGPRVSWRRVSPDGRLFRPATLSRESRWPTSSPGV